MRDSEGPSGNETAFGQSLRRTLESSVSALGKRWTAVVQRASGRILLVCLGAFFLAVGRPRLGAAVSLYLLLGLAVLLGLARAPLLAAAALGLILAGGLVYLPGDVARAESFFQAAVVFLALLVPRLFLDEWLITTRRGGSFAAWGAAREKHSLRILWAVLRVTLAVIGSVVQILERSTRALRSRLSGALGPARSAVARVGSELHRQFGTRLFFVLLALALFLLPFTWFRAGEGDFGGDATRLYFVDPVSWLRSVALTTINISGHGFANPNFFLLPFLFLLIALDSLLGHQPTLVLSAFNGFLLVTAFFSVYALVRDLPRGGRTTFATRAAGLLGAAAYIFSQLLMYQWPKYLYHYHQIAIYPFLTWLLLHFLRRGAWRIILGALLLTVVFSVNFAVFTVPNWAAFFPFAAVLLAAVALFEGRFRIFLRGALLFVALALPLHAFHLLPEVANLLDPRSDLYAGAFTPEGRANRGLAYFEAIRPRVRLTYNLVGFNQLELYRNTGASTHIIALLTRYGERWLPLFLLFPLLALVTTLRPGQTRGHPAWRPFLALLGLTGIALFFMTANLFGEAGPRFYARLFHLPGFAAFRSYVGVFQVVFVFLAALTIGLAVRLLLARVRDRRFAILGLAALFLLLLLPARPFLSGEIVNAAISDTRGVKLSNAFRPSFRSLLSGLRELPLDAKVSTLPWTTPNYQVVDGAFGGAYVGPSPVAFLAGRHTFGGLGDFDAPGSHLFNQTFLLERLRAGDLRTVNRLLHLANIGLVVHTSSPAVYEGGFTGFPYSRELFALFHTTADFGERLPHLGFTAFRTYEHYTLASSLPRFLPHLYIPRLLVVGEDPAVFAKFLMESSQFDAGVAFVAPSAFARAPSTGAPVPVENPPGVEFRRIDATKYFLRLHGLRNSVPLVFSEVFHPGWRLFARTPGSPSCDEKRFSASAAASLGSAAPELARTWCRTNRISSAGPAFVSTDFFGTVQNDNLPRGPLWETWKLRPLPEELHVRANEYANAWWLDLPLLEREFPSALRKNPDGTADLELLLEFTPQRWFYGGSALSLLTLVGVVAALLVKRRGPAGARTRGVSVGPGS